MSTPFSLFDPNSPQVQAMIARNPNGFFASMINRNTPPANNLGGSNNAGGGVPGGLGVTPNPGFRGGLPPNMAGMQNYESKDQAGFMGSNNMPSFAAGGMMSEQGTAIRPGMPMPPSAGNGRTLPSARFKVEPQEPQLGAAGPVKMSSQQIEQEVNNFMKAQPQEVQKIQQVIVLAMQTGQLTPDELNQAVQLAKVALANPASYPQIRQFAIQNGLGTEQELPEEMDQGLLYALILAGKAMSQAGARADVPTSGNAMAGQGPAPTGPKGGILPEYSQGGETGSKAHVAKLHPREYVIPEKAVLYYGTKKFGDMIKAVEEAENEPNE